MVSNRKKNEQPSKNFYDVFSADRCESLIKAANLGELEMKALSRANYPGLNLSDEVLSNICSIGYWDAKKNQNWGLDWHRNEGLEFTFLSSGSLEFSVENDYFNLTPGDLTITRPWQLHKVGNPSVTSSKLYWLIIDVGVIQPHQDWNWPDWIILSKEDMTYLTKILRQNEMAVWKTTDALHNCFRKIGRCINESQTNANTLIRIPHSKLNILINELFLQIVYLFKNGRVKLDESLTINLRTVEIFLNHLRSDYERHWTLEEMAEHCGLGMTSLSKYCKQITNLTPINYLIKVRLEVAARLLVEEQNKSVTKIGYECGFSSGQYFATAFKRQFNTSPKSYRANWMAKNEEKLLEPQNIN